MKKLGLHIVGALVLSSIPMKAANANKVSAYKKRRYFECYSDKKITQVKKLRTSQVHEFSALVSGTDEKTAELVAKRNFLTQKNKVKTETIAQGAAHVENTGKYLVFQGEEWALAIAPEKKRASLYSSNPDINEIPMFCLSQVKN